MSASVKVKECPKCGGRATAESDPHSMHGVAHAIQHGISHASPLAFGIGLLGAGVQVFKSYRYRCAACGNGFFSR